MRLAACLTILALAAAACARSDARPATADPQWKSEGVPPADATVTGHLRRADLVESSGAAMSATQPGLIFTINDSGNRPLLYATDSTGADRGAWRVTGATDLDWESIAVGPCGTSGDAGVAAAGPPRCVFVGDTGDNAERRATRTIYRVPEPTAAAAGSTGATPKAERLTYVYDGGPRDVEAMTVGPTGEISFYTKRPLENPAGRLRPSLVFRLPASAWRTGSIATPAVAALSDSLSAIVPGAGPGASLVTDAALSASRRRLAVRTYTTVYVYASDPATGRILAGARPAVCDVSSLGGDFGEGLTWLGAGRLVLMSEGRASSLDAVRCPDPETPNESAR
jgi:hypothetical protein